MEAVLDGHQRDVKMVPDGFFSGVLETSVGCWCESGDSMVDGVHQDLRLAVGGYS